MTNNSWRGIAEIVGIAAIVGSLIFVGLELQQSIAIAKSEASFNAIVSSDEMVAAENEHADIWVRGNAGEDLDRAEKSIYANLIYARQNRAFWETEAHRNLGRYADIPVHLFAAFLHRNPGARNEWERLSREQIAWRAILIDRKPDIRSMSVTIQADLEKLDQQAMQP